MVKRFLCLMIFKRFIKLMNRGCDRTAFFAYFEICLVWLNIGVGVCLLCF